MGGIFIASLVIITGGGILYWRWKRQEKAVLKKTENTIEERSKKK